MYLSDMLCLEGCDLAFESCLDSNGLITDQDKFTKLWDLLNEPVATIK